MCSQRDSNRRPLDLESNAQPIEPPHHPIHAFISLEQLLEYKFVGTTMVQAAFVF